MIQTDGIKRANKLVKEPRTWAVSLAENLKKQKNVKRDGLPRYCNLF
jgi:hypothetical protein